MRITKRCRGRASSTATAFRIPGIVERYTTAEHRRLELAQLLYKNGEAAYLDVLTAPTDLYNSQLVLVSARLQRLTNLVDLYRALGGGWLEHSGDEPRPGDTRASREATAAK